MTGRINALPYDIADQVVCRIIAANDPAKLFDSTGGIDPVLIASVAACSPAEQDGFKNRLITAYPKDFQRQQWSRRLREEQNTARLRLVEDGERSEFLMSEKGKIISCVANAIVMMRKLPLAYNSFSCRVILTSPSPWGTVGVWTDADDIKASEWCQHQGLMIEKNTSTDASYAVALENQFHPVKHYLQGLRWDGEPRIDRWLYKYLGCADNRYTRSIAAAWLISGCARIMVPGCQCDYTLVLEGAQGKKKSSALRALAGEWFTDDISEVGTKDSAMQLQGMWIVEISELDAFRKTEMTTVKAWLVRREDNFRPPFGRRSAQFSRQNIFAGTTNKDEWGNDDTGLRRFWPVRVGNVIHVDDIRRDRDQLWAEAMHRYMAGEQWHLSPESEDLARCEQADRQEVDPWQEKVLQWVAAPFARQGEFSDLRSTSEKIYVNEIMQHCIGLPMRDWKRSDKERITRILRLDSREPRRSPRSEADEDGSRAEFWVKKNKE